jgi:hypothetical protein
LDYAQGDPLWIIVACRQIKNKRAPEQISTDAVTLVARAGFVRGEYRVSKHVKVGSERWSRTEDDDEKEGEKIKSIQRRFMSVNEWVSYDTTQGTWKRKGREWSGVAGTVCVVMHYNGQGIVKG